MFQLKYHTSLEPPFALRYGVALAASALALLLTWLTLPFIERTLFVWFYVAVVFSAWYGGIGPALLTTIIGGLSVEFYFIPLLGPGNLDVTELLTLGTFALVGLMVSALTDQRRRLAKTAREQHEQLRITLTSIGDAVIATDMQGRITLMNPVAEALTGWSGDDARGQKLDAVFRIVDAETHQAVESPAARVLREGTVVGLANHTLLIAKDGAEIPIDDSGAPIRDSHGNISGVVLVFRDITARKQADDLLARYRLLSEHARDIILLIRQDGRIVEANQAAVDAYGYDRTALLAKTIYDLRDPATTAAVGAQMSRAVADGLLFETSHRRGDGTIFPVEVSSRGAVIGGERLLLSIIRDIGERKWAEAERAQLASIVDSSDDAIIGKSLDGIILSWNAAAERIYGYPAGEAIGRPIDMLAPPDRPDEIPRILEQIRRGEHIARLETLRVRKDGVTIPVSLTISPVWDANGTITGASTIARDITERKHAEAALRESEARFRTMADSAPMLIWASGTDMLCDFFNQTWLDFTGRTIEQELGNGWTEGVHPDDYDRCLEIYTTSFQRRQSFSMEYRLRRADGVYRWILDNGLPRTTPDGAFAGYIGSCVDITGHKQAIARADHLQRISSALSEALTPAEVAEVVLSRGIAALGSQAGTIALLNDAGDTIELINTRGYPAELGDHWKRFALTTATPLAECVRTGAPVLVDSLAALQERYPDHGGAQIGTTYRAWAALPLLIEGRAIGGLGLSFAEPRSFSAEDQAFMVTLANQCAQAIERARLYQAEREAHASAEAAVRLRDQFLSIAAHELKTPITSLLGYAQLFQRRMGRAGQLTEPNQRALRVIVEQAGRLNQMVAALLDVSRIETGQLSISQAPLDLVALVRRLTDELQPQLAGRALTLECPDEPIVVLGDELRLEQVIQNLIQNAIKYSPSGAPIVVRVALRHPDGEQGGCRACVAVADRGIGIPAESLPQLFQRFYRAPNASNHQISGMGVGLYV
ncbi:MAG TPA: PAS domain S-box protein, partial [Roseiflexaceae bacterium]